MVVISLEISSLACMKGSQAQAWSSLPLFSAGTMDDGQRFGAYSSFLSGLRILSTLERYYKLKIYVAKEGQPEEKVYDSIEWCDQEWLGRMQQEAKLY